MNALGCDEYLQKQSGAGDDSNQFAGGGNAEK